MLLAHSKLLLVLLNITFWVVATTEYQIANYTCKTKGNVLE
jgi:hypothetical protein